MGKARLLATEASFSWLDSAELPENWRHLPACEAISVAHAVHISCSEAYFGLHTVLKKIKHSTY